MLFRLSLSLISSATLHPQSFAISLQSYSFQGVRLYCQADFCVRYPQETCTLLKCRRAEPWHLHQLRTAAECSVGRAVVYYILCKRRSKAAHIGEQVFAGGVKVYTNRVDTAFNGKVKALFQLGLVNVVLILSYADALGSIFTSSARGSISRLPMLTAPRTVTSLSGNSSRAVFEAE